MKRKFNRDNINLSLIIMSTLLEELEINNTELPKDILVSITISALENYKTKEMGRRMKIDIEKLQVQLFFMEWKDIISNSYERVYTSYERREYMLHALELYKNDYKEKLSIGLHGTINSMIGELKFWLSNYGQVKIPS